MLLFVPVGVYRLKWFFSALMVLCRRTLFAIRYSLREAHVPVPGGNLIATGVVIAVYFAETFSLGSWIGGLVLFVFACVGRSIATGDAGTQVATGVRRPN